ncbi:TonB-dependent receptor domain-containing protein [Paraflavitalea speifideaquila]|uniref:TonB-dependent receptor domain-containing protein n=1 Tax=Paraflavitalea speifideaquila TaxID=3076558 RepID=UPI0028E4B608|nr:TonB-dependent receptor [Paraflavitalea speifideiaquila]
MVGRIMYNYDGKYTVMVSAGYNGAENFPAGKRFGLFPAISASWDLAKEAFLADHLPFVDQLKLRGAYGVTGSSALPGARFSYLSQWNSNSGGYQFGVNRDGASYSGAYEVRIPNTNLTWEKGYKTDVGLDAGLWKGGLNLTVEYFRERRQDILITSELVPAAIGLFNAPALNAAIVNKSGIDLSVEHRKEFKKQGYSIRVNYSFVKNKVIDYRQPEYKGREWQRRTGTEVGSIYGYTAIGLFRDEDDIAKSPSQSVFGMTKPGDIKYKDLNGDGLINSLDAGFCLEKGTSQHPS